MAVETVWQTWTLFADLSWHPSIQARTHWSQWPRVTWMQHLGDWAHHFKKSSTPPCNHLFSKCDTIHTDLCWSLQRQAFWTIRSSGESRSSCGPSLHCCNQRSWSNTRGSCKSFCKIVGFCCTSVSSGVLVEAPETVGFTTQSTQTVTVPVPVAPVPVVPVAPSATAATVATAAATASITSIRNWHTSNSCQSSSSNGSKPSGQKGHPGA